MNIFEISTIGEQDITLLQEIEILASNLFCSLGHSMKLKVEKGVLAL